MILSPKEAIKRLTLSRSTFYKLVRQGHIKTVKLSEKRIGVLDSELVRYLSELNDK
jgi:excisionase family DNA binding protein